MNAAERKEMVERLHRYPAYVLEAIRKGEMSPEDGRKVLLQMGRVELLANLDELNEGE